MNKDKIKKISELIIEIYRHHMSGGRLHLVVDDGNIEDRHIECCLKLILDEFNDPHENKDRLKTELECARLLQSCTLAERQAAINLADEQINTPTEKMFIYH